MKFEALSFISSAVGTAATVAYAYIAFLQLRQNSQGQKVSNEGHAVGRKFRFNSIIFKGLTFVFAAVGAVSIFIFASITLVAAGINAVAPQWNPIESLQADIASRVVALIAPHVTIVQSEDKSKPGKYSPAKADSFVVSLSPANRSDDMIAVKATLENTTSEPLYIAINSRQRPILTDDNSSLTAKLLRLAGISEAYPDMRGREKEVVTYTKVPSGQKLDLGLEFRPYPRGTSQNNSQVHVTMEFLRLNNGKVERISVSPGAPIIFDLGLR